MAKPAAEAEAEADAKAATAHGTAADEEEAGGSCEGGRYSTPAAQPEAVGVS